MPITDKNVGNSFEDFLDEQGLLEECTETAIKRVIAFQVRQMMEERRLTKTAMAQKMQTSRSSLNRLLDPNNEAVTLQTMKKAAAVLGRKLRLELT